MDGLFHGKSHLEMKWMITRGIPIYANLHMPGLFLGFTMIKIMIIVSIDFSLDKFPKKSSNIIRRLPGILLFLGRHELHHLHADAGLLRVHRAARRAQRFQARQRRHVTQAQQGEVQRGLAQATEVVPLVVGLLETFVGETSRGPENRLALKPLINWITSLHFQTHPTYTVG